MVQPMTDWKRMAEAIGLDVPDRTLAPLSSLESTFAPLTRELEPDDEPAVIFTPALERLAK